MKPVITSYMSKPLTKYQEKRQRNLAYFNQLDFEREKERQRKLREELKEKKENMSNHIEQHIRKIFEIYCFPKNAQNDDSSEAFNLTDALRNFLKNEEEIKEFKNEVVKIFMDNLVMISPQEFEKEVKSFQDRIRQDKKIKEARRLLDIQEAALNKLTEEEKTVLKNLWGK